METYAVPAPKPVLIQTNDRFYHVQVRPEDAFTEFRTRWRETPRCQYQERNATSARAGSALTSGQSRVC